MYYFIYIICCVLLSSTYLHTRVLSSSPPVKRKSTLPQGDKILKSLQYNKLDKVLSQDLLTVAEKAIKSWSSQPSIFLSQPAQKAVADSFKDVVGLKLDFAGGFDSAENCRAIFQKAAEEREDYYEGNIVQL